MENQTQPRLNMFLQIEGLAIFLGALVAYYLVGGVWWLFLLLCLAPDLAMVGYLVNTEVGARSYNLIHLYILPLVLAGVGLALESEIIMQVAIIWVAHIGIDRAIGYGLKYPTEFKDTHLQRV